MVNEIGITRDPIADLFRDIAEHGRRIHDPPVRNIVGEVVGTGLRSVDHISGAHADRADLVEEPR
jgi:hypothetical protein